MGTARSHSRWTKRFDSSLATALFSIDNYTPLVDALKSLRTGNFIVDGEIAALDEKGRSSFQLLQWYGVAKGIPLVYYALDLLSREGTDLRSRALVERRELLAKLLKKAPENIKFSEEPQGTREELLQIARRRSGYGAGFGPRAGSTAS